MGFSFCETDGTSGWEQVGAGGFWYTIAVEPIRELLTDFALVGAAVLFAAWLLLIGGRWFTRQLAAIRPYLAAFLVFTFVAMNYAQKSGTNEPPRGASNVREESFDGRVEGTNEELTTTEHAEAAVAGTENGWGGVTDRLPQPPVRVAEGASEPSVVELFRLESETTNETYSYVVPANGMRYEKWWRRGAYEDVFEIDLDGMLFPFGEYLCDSLWVYSWGMAGRSLADASNRVVATGVPMSAVPGVSRFWSAEAADGGRLLTWENFFLNRDTNTPVSAQLELRPSGDYIARSNLVERLYRRVNPDDWDDDGIMNDDDLDPYFYDGDNFGLHQELPQGANSNAYCWVDLVVPNANARVRFIGDGLSALPDPAFIAKAGETNRVTLLIGKTYQVTSCMPISCVDQSSGDIEVYQISPTELQIVWPVVIEASTMRSGSSFSMSVWPDCLGGGFVWTNSCCSISSSAGVFTYSCNDACHCTGCAARGYYAYEGYCLPADGCGCGCSSDGEYDERPSEEDDGPYAAGASATFSKSAVIFEDGYWNTPANWVERQSTQTELHCVAHGGPNGGHVRFEIAGENKLERIIGHLLPVEQDVSPGKKLDFTIVYKGRLPSAGVDDIIVTTTFTENIAGATPASSQAKLTSVKVELEAVYVAPGNTNQNRHLYGVGEKVRLRHMPESAALVWSLGNNDFFSELLDENGCDKVLQLHYLGGTVSDVVATFGNETHHPTISVIEPQSIVCSGQMWNGECLPKGQAGGFGMRLWLYIGPMCVSFQGIDVAEIPCETIVQPTGYYATTNFNGVLSHSLAAGAGYWHHVSAGNYWCQDEAKSNFRRQIWSNGVMTWNIPIQWYQRLDASESWTRGFVHADGRLIGGSESAYRQVFEITANGTITVSKHQHYVERTTNDVIRLDGTIVHDGNH